VAIRTHHEVGREVRETIRKIGGTMPENLHPEPPIKKLLAAKRKQLRAAKKLLSPSHDDKKTD
jgi:DNA-damage-inducible protein D